MYAHILFSAQENNAEVTLFFQRNVQCNQAKNKAKFIVEISVNFTAK